MAFLRKNILKSGERSYKIIFLLNGARKTIFLSRKYSEEEAKEVCGMVQSIANCIAVGRPGTAALEAWIDNLDPLLRKKLENADLLVPRDQDASAITIQLLFRRFFSFPSDRKDSTIENYTTTEKRLYDVFPKDELVAAITSERANQYRMFQLQRHSKATVGGYIKNLRAVWKFGIGLGIVEENPWLSVKKDSQLNPARKEYIPITHYYRLLDACPNQSWRTLIALCRIGGLRCDSETSALTWQDVDWLNKRVLIRSRKTERYTGKDYRVIPLFPALEQELSAQFAEAEEGTLHVLPDVMRNRANLRMPFDRIIIRAGLVRWERAFNNLRASRDTELQAHFPPHVVASWLGHSVQVSNDHYLMVRDEDYERGASFNEVNFRPSSARFDDFQKRAPKRCEKESKKALFSD